MIWLNLFFFLVSLFCLGKSAQYATLISSKLARTFHLSEFVISFFIISVISVLPEASISVISAFEGIPEFGLATLLGSNVVDLTLVIGIIAIFSRKGVKVRSQVLQKDFFYLTLLVFPIILGWDGNLSRTDGIVLVLSGVLFFFTLYIESNIFRKKISLMKSTLFYKNLGLMVLSVIALGISAYFTIESSVSFANDLGIPAVVVGLLMVSVGTCLPELFFSIKSLQSHHEQLALGNILGTVIIDATIILGIVSMINPIFFDRAILYTTGLSMFFAALLLVIFIRIEKVLTKLDGVYLLFFFLIFMIIEFITNHLFS